MAAQLGLMELLGVGTRTEEMVKWLAEEKNGKKFADLVDNDPDLVARLAERNLSEAEISFLRDEFLFDKIDTGDEDHTPGPEPDD